MAIKRIALSVVMLACGMAWGQQAGPVEKGKEMIAKGLEYLKGQQKEDGSWQTSDDPPAISAIVLQGFVESGMYSAKDDFVKKGYEKLLASQKEDGGIYEGMLSNYNTAIAVSSLSAAKEPAFQTQLDKAVAFLRHIQWTDVDSLNTDGKKVNKVWYGGWGYGGRTKNGGRPDLSNVQLTMDALHDSGLKADDPAFKAATEFVTHMQNLSATNDQPWASNDGGFIYSPGNDGEGASVAGVYNDPSGHRRLRSYGSMTSAGLKSYLYAGLSKEDPRVKAAFDWISENYTLDGNPGMGDEKPENAQAGLYYYYHTLARALNAYDSPTITDKGGKAHDWRVELIEKAGQLQKPDGSFVGEKKWMESNSNLVTAYVVLALEEVEQDLMQHPPA
ncbi:MAG TPA: prenyltransferase/squalene oxidase repeat-containing protein [Tepidisphaeraceae bacterium]|jgi:squalene-hopene/tetraprenyl-beta-curcumene cyclase|nr:prenyltransferase/squalene oxidase repeat-containing protein [Tepidisphaeraceae bacterium]